MRSALTTLSLAVLLGAAPAVAQTKPATPPKKAAVTDTTKKAATAPATTDSNKKVKKHTAKKHKANTPPAN